MRGICIIAVVLTHIIDKKLINPNYEVALIIQNIVNIAVTGFVFLTGYFINIDEVRTNTKKYIIRKSKRILIPYVLWSIFYVLSSIVLSHKNYTLVELVRMFLLGKASGPLYYCILYFLFILITPFVVKKMENKIWNIIFWFIMPI